MTDLYEDLHTPDHELGDFERALLDWAESGPTPTRRNGPKGQHDALIESLTPEQRRLWKRIGGDLKGVRMRKTSCLAVLAKLIDPDTLTVQMSAKTLTDLVLDEVPSYSYDLIRMHALHALLNLELVRRGDKVRHIDGVWRVATKSGPEVGKVTISQADPDDPRLLSNRPEKLAALEALRAERTARTGGTE